ncbi:SixA phosphatase family protein [Psychroflexus sp. ALD_RP9]|uniref:SixA phosphatase family protein n=1 Tax=Psychroflexus sp. ALD_RP9 TaxID=2777186 RepID=UPI001A8E28D5|nr:histidine phosphatase family protein [Psychroflexus sp. ALD_RP9]QSS96758.1 histidine phosphatase family protein [Psychroflexus sp. ALD_RP9]
MSLKTLVLIRHGKSSWSNPELDDFYRPLKKRAIHDAELVSEAFKKVNTKTFYALSSDAKRAFETAKLIKKNLPKTIINLEKKHELYTFSPSSLLEVILSTSPDINELMIFGHNPAITDVANQLGHQLFNNIPTTGLVQLTFEVDNWSQIAEGKTQFYLFPKNLR